MNRPAGFTKSQKKKYAVYTQYFFNTEFEEDDSFTDDWTFMGYTYAVSEKQAVNNVRHRIYGDYGTSQYLPMATGGHWENGLNWKAEIDI